MAQNVFFVKIQDGSHDLLSDNSKWLRMTTGIIPENFIEIEAIPAEL